MRSRQLLLAAFLLLSAVANAGVPDWVRKAARFPLPSNAHDANAVVLLDDQSVTVNGDGSYHTVNRRVVKILSAEGRWHQRVRVNFNERNRLTYLKGWTIAADGKEYDIKENEAVETSVLNEAYFSDSRDKILMLPAAEIGAVVAYEYQRDTSETRYEFTWLPQDVEPTAIARLSMRVPDDTNYEVFWANHEPTQPQRSGQWLTWEFSGLEALTGESLMPHFQAIAPMLVVHFTRAAKPEPRWEEIGGYFDSLARDRSVVTPEVRSQAEKLVAGTTAPLERMAKLAAFVQADIRYLDIVIGIGGLQPHAAGDVLANRYGDCKDKTTLFSALLNAAGYRSYPVLVHSDFGVTRADVPTLGAFNHLISAIVFPTDVEVPPNAPVLNTKWGTVLFFDATSTLTPFGSIPIDLQGNYALLVHDGTGELVQLPVAPPSEDMLDRTATLKLLPDGTLSGTVEELRRGYLAEVGRSILLHGTYTDRDKALEAFLSTHLGGGRLTSLSVDDLDQISRPLKTKYQFVNDNYSRRSGALITVRPRVLGTKWPDLLEDKPRRFPIDFGGLTEQRDRFEIELPSDVAVSEVPDPVDMKTDFAEYHSKTTAAPGKLIFEREYRLLMRQVPASRLNDVRKFFRAVANDERNSAILEAKK